MSKSVIDVYKDHCVDSGCYPFVIDPEWGKDIIIPNHPELFIKPPSHPRCIISFSSFINTCVDAKHYYAAIDADSPHLFKREGGEIKWVGGYVCKEWDEMPKKVKDCCKGTYTIILRRKLKASDVAADPIRWEGYDVGDYTEAFDSKEAALALAVSVARRRFPKYKIEIIEQVL